MSTESYSTTAPKETEGGLRESTITDIRDTSDDWRESRTLFFSNSLELPLHSDDEGLPKWLPLLRVGDVVPLLPHGYVDARRLGAYLAAGSPVVAAPDARTCWCGAPVDDGCPTRSARGHVMQCVACEPGLSKVEVDDHIEERQDELEAAYWARAGQAASTSRAQGFPSPSSLAWAEVQVAHQECTRQLALLGGPASHSPEATLTRSRPEIGVVHGAVAWPTLFVRPHAGEDGLSFVQDRVRAAHSALVVTGTARLRDRFALACDLDTPAGLDLEAEAHGTRKGLLQAPRLATCLPSLGRVAAESDRSVRCFEVVVLPDIQTVRCALTVDEHSPALWQRLGDLLRAAKHVIVMDPYLDNDDESFVRAWRPQVFLRVRNEYLPIRSVPVLVVETAMDAQRHAFSAAAMGKRIAILTSHPGAKRILKRSELNAVNVGVVGRDEITRRTRVVVVPPNADVETPIEVDEAVIVGFGAPTGGPGFAPQPATKVARALLRNLTARQVFVGVDDATAALETDPDVIWAEIEHDQKYAEHRAMRRCGGWKTEGSRRARTLGDQYDLAYCDHYVRSVASQHRDRVEGVSGLAGLLAAAGGVVRGFDELKELGGRGETGEKALHDARTAEAKAHKTARDRVEDQRIQQICAAPQAPADPDARTAFQRDWWRAPASDERDAALERERLEHNVLDRRSLNDLPQDVRELLIRRAGGEPSRLRGIALETAYRLHSDYRDQFEGRTVELRRRHTASVRRGYSPHLDQRLPAAEALVAIVGAVTRGARVDDWQAEWTEMDGRLFTRGSGHDTWTEITDALNLALGTVPGGLAALRKWLAQQLPSEDVPAKLLAAVLRALGAELTRPRNTKHRGSLRLVDGRELAVARSVPSYSVEPSCWRVVLALVQAPQLSSSRSIGGLE